MRKLRPTKPPEAKAHLSAGGAPGRPLPSQPASSPRRAHRPGRCLHQPSFPAGEANDRGGEAKPGRTHESRRRKTEKGPEAPPAGRPAVHPLGRHRATAAASSRALPALGSPKARCKSASEQQESKPGLEAGTKRTASAGREAPGRDAALSRRSHSESGALREGSHRSQAANTAPSRFPSRQPSGGGA